jgi:hypothetical protein
MFAKASLIIFSLVFSALESKAECRFDISTYHPATESVPHLRPFARHLKHTFKNLDYKKFQVYEPGDILVQVNIYAGIDNLTDYSKCKRIPPNGFSCPTTAILPEDQWTYKYDVIVQHRQKRWKQEIRCVGEEGCENVLENFNFQKLLKDRFAVTFCGQMPKPTKVKDASSTVSNSGN